MNGRSRIAVTEITLLPPVELGASTDLPSVQAARVLRALSKMGKTRMKYRDCYFLTPGDLDRMRHFCATTGRGLTART